MINDTNKTLLALTAAALTLPGLARNATAASANDDVVISYRHSNYTESEMDPNVTAEGDVARYTIDVHQVRFKTAIGSETELTIDGLQESMSGASPWYILPDVDGKPIQVMSGASIFEERVQGDISLTTYADTAVSSVGISYSTENDYDSYGFSTGYVKSLNQNNTELAIGVGISKDYLKPTDSDLYPYRVEEERKTSGSVSVGLTRVINRSSLINFSVEYALYDGFLSDTYKLVYVDGDLLPDSRPDSRIQWAFTTSYRKHFNNWNSSLHLDYRYFGNDWESNSHTLEMDWYKSFGESWQISPQLRVYYQTQATFYQNYFTRTRADGYYSSDYRLSEFSAVSGSIKLSKFFSFGALHLSYESYASKGKDGKTLMEQANPSLVEFSRYTIGIDLKF